jgi:hypothetical protein
MIANGLHCSAIREERQGENVMNKNQMILFTRFGMGTAPAELQQKLASVFLTLLNQDTPPGVIAFYGEGVRLTARIRRYWSNCASCRIRAFDSSSARPVSISLGYAI